MIVRADQASGLGSLLAFKFFQGFAKASQAK
jgi:hypothetical protein